MTQFCVFGRNIRSESPPQEKLMYVWNELLAVCAVSEYSEPNSIPKTKWQKIQISWYLGVPKSDWTISF